MKTITIKSVFSIPDDIHEMDIKNKLVQQLDYLGVIIEDVFIVTNEFTPESKKKIKPKIKPNNHDKRTTTPNKRG